MKTNKQKGFTLIEIIVTLVLIGIIAAVAGIGIVGATRAYLFTKDASSISQKAQAVIARLNKTFVNVSDVSISGGTPSAQAITVVIERDNAYITETYNFSGTSLTLTIGGSTNTLLDDIDTGASGFVYLKNDGSTWNTSSDKKDLSRIQVNLAMNSSGGQAVGFSGSFVPRNIYRPVEISDFGSGSGTTIPNVSGCFISSLSEGKHMERLTGYILAGALLILLLVFVVRRTTMNKSSQGGSVLIATIVTIVVMGILGGAMVSIFSSSSVGTVTPSISNRAYYNAESAYRYVLYTFLNTDEGSRFQTLRDDVNGKTLVLDGDNQADIDIEAFWFTVAGNQNNTRNLTVESPISYPGEYWSAGGSLQIPSTGHISVEGQDDDNPFSYSSVSYSSVTGRFTFTLTNNITANDGDSVFLAFENSTMTSTISEGDDLSVGGGGSLVGWPRKNGVISLVTNAGGTYVLTYERVNDDKTQLINVNSAADFAALPSGGLQNYGGINHVTLNRNARITATGHAGGGSGSFSAERRIVYYQPLIEGVVVIKHEYTDNFNNLNNWRTGGGEETGDHGIVTVNDAGVENEAGDNAMTVTGTESKDGPVSGIFAAYYGKGVQESLIEYSPDVADFQDIWDKSDEKLSYEVQCKISFSGINDNADNNPQGTFMPGIVFRARESETYSGVKEYYGLSFMRALFQQGQVSDPDADDIPDQYLFENHALNDTIPSSVEDDICIADYEPSPRWNDTPPMSGVPYMIFWQQAFDFEQWDGIWVRNSDLYLDWLSYVPLCQLTPVTIYRYNKETIIGEDSVPCGECAACTPKEWTKYFWDSPIGYDWYPDCCIARTQIDSGGFFNPWRRYRCDTYDCTDSCYNATCCGPTLNYPAGWYLGPIPGDPRTPIEYAAYQITDHAEYGQILEHANIRVGGVDFDIIGSINNTVYLIRDPSTFHQPTGYRGDPIENAAFIFPTRNVSFQTAHNYRVYLKPWVTVMARIIEMKGDFFDENGSGCGNSADERVNVIQAWFGEPGTYPRGQIRWPDKNSASFSEMIWPDSAYTSKMDEVRTGWITNTRRLVERGEDEYTNTSDKRSPYVYTNQLTSAGYDGYSQDNQPAEIGLHTFGIDATGDDEEHKDRVYFDDFALRVFEYGHATGVLAGVQSE